MSETLAPELLLLGIGTGGCRMAYAIRQAYGAEMRVICADTDAMTTRMDPLEGMTPLLLGGSRLAGAGSGGDLVQARHAAQDDVENIISHLQGVRTVVVIACLGGGTGSGATPEIIKRLHDTGVTTLCFVTLPFPFEGDSRVATAQRVLPLLDENADSLVTVPLADLYADAAEERLEAAMANADRVMAAGVSLLWRSLRSPGFIRLDPERLHKMILQGGNARFGFASATGDDRAIESVKALDQMALLRKGDALRRAKAVLLGILAGSDLRLAEVGGIMRQLQGLVQKPCKIEMGTVLDDRFNGRIELVLVAFESWTVTEDMPAMPLLTPAPAVTVEAVKGGEGASAEPPVVEAMPVASAVRRGRRSASKLSFGPSGLGKFQNMEQTLVNGQDLDIPTFQRRGITLER
ncbi:MAG: hypothetical protein J6334_09245 [Kiritimatiellae bacterium]|nr:hypothetical protein [Kiritimatiellia bacterium]